MYNIICALSESCSSEGEVRLAGVAYKGVGRVEVCLGGAWGTIYDSYWESADATVVCRQLGYSMKGIESTV